MSYDNTNVTRITAPRNTLSATMHNKVTRRRNSINFFEAIPFLSLLDVCKNPIGVHPSSLGLKDPGEIPITAKTPHRESNTIGSKDSALLRMLPSTRTVCTMRIESSVCSGHERILNIVPRSWLECSECSFNCIFCGMSCNDNSSASHVLRTPLYEVQ
jgi:hypothetical protein